MGAIIFRKREHLSERQRVVRTLKIMASMGPIARLCTGSIRTQRSPLAPHRFQKQARDPSSLLSVGMTEWGALLG